MRRRWERQQVAEKLVQPVIMRNSSLVILSGAKNPRISAQGKLSGASLYLQNTQMQGFFLRFTQDRLRLLRMTV